MNIRSTCLIVLFIITSTTFSYSQKRDYVWTFGGDSYDDEIIGMQINFSDSSFNVERLQLTLRNNSSHPSICDEDGGLLFYTNGCAVINSNHKVMPNGHNLNDDPWKELLNWDNCELGYPGHQEEMIIPDPSYKDGYYLIHKPKTLLNNNTAIPLWVSYIDMTLDNGMGDVVYKDSLVYNDRELMSSYLEVMPHSNRRDWWLIQPLVEDSLFVTMLIDEKGIHQLDYQNTHQYFDAFRSSSSGTARFSPDGTKYAIYNYYDNLNLYDFDRSTGLLTHLEKVEIINNPDRTSIKFGSLEWSPNSRFIYTVSQDSLFQVDTWSNDIESSITLIDTYDGTTNPLWATFTLQTLGPDCRIYISSGSSSETFHVINKPDELGLDCDFRQNGIMLPQPHGNTNLPLFPRFRVDAEDKCDSSITSMFGEIVYYRYDLQAYPNPAKDIITIEVPEFIGQSNMTIYNNHGEVMQSKILFGQETILTEDISAYPGGVYHIEVYPDNNPERKVYTSQILKIE